MADQNNPGAPGSPGEEDVAADSQTQQRARPRVAKSRRRRRRQTTSERQGEDEPRAFQVYKFSSRAPPTSVHCNGGSSSGRSRIPALPDDGDIIGMMARSASYWVKREPPRCWVRDCTCACSETLLEEDHPSGRRVLPRDLLDEEDRWTYPMREELFSRDEDNGGSLGDTGTASAWADVGSDDDGRSFAEEYSLVPLSRRKQYSAQTFHEAVERYFRGL